MSDTDSMLRGAELMTQAFLESAISTTGWSFGRVVERFCELSGIDRLGSGVFCVLHQAGGLTVNNAIGDCYRPVDRGALGVDQAGRGAPDLVN